MTTPTETDVERAQAIRDEDRETAIRLVPPLFLGNAFKLVSLDNFAALEAKLSDDIAVALSAARAEERQKIAGWLDCPQDCRYANASGTCQRTDGICSHHVAESIRAGERP